MENNLIVQWQGGSHALEPGRPITIGRGPDCEIRIEAADISRHHATIEAAATGDAVLRDLGSANGTWVNGIRLQPNTPTRVTPGDNILIASTLVVIAGGPAVQVAEPAAAQAAPSATVVEVPERPARALRARGSGPGTARRVLAGFAFVVAFLGYTATNAVDSKLLDSNYYKTVLEDSNAYERAYTEVAPDPALSNQVSDLLGGVELPIGAIAGAVQTVAPPFILQTAVEAAIDRLIEFLKNNRSLDVAIDVTTIVQVTDIGGITDIITDVIGRPTRQADSYEAFLSDLNAAIEGIRASGSMPAVIPDYDIPPANRTQVADLILRGGGLSRDDRGDASAIEKVERAVADNDMETALGTGMKAVLTRGSAGKSLVQGKYIHEVSDGGQTKYFLGPPPEVTRDLSEVISIVHLVSWAAGWGRFAAIGLGAALLVTIAALSYPRTRSMLQWTGGSLVTAGVLGFVGWLWGREIGQDRILGVTLGEQSTLPASYQDLYRDVLSNAAGNLTPTIWAPCIVAMVAGAVLLAGSRVSRR